MKRRKFIQSTVVTSVAASTLATPLMAGNQSETEDNQQIYEFRIYTIQFGGPQQQLHNYLQKAFIPALNRFGVKNVGVFRELADPNPVRIFVLIPYNSLQHMGEVNAALKTDATFLADSSEYTNLSVQQKVYSRYDSWLLEAFSGIPVMKLPPAGEHIFELRTYEGYSEDAVNRKVKMFNKEELTIFDETKLNALFFGHVMIGPQMPALTYMLWFNNMEERDANWKAFIDHPVWKTVSKLPEYANSVSNIIRIFLKAEPYSQI